MAQTAAHSVDHVFAPSPVRHWVLSVPKRLRGFLQREPEAVHALLHRFLRSVEAALRTHSPGTGPQARLGAVSFLQRFGSALNPHMHSHCCVLDGLFEAASDADAEVRFREAVRLSAQAGAARARAPRRTHASRAADDARLGAGRGFPLDAEARIEGWDKDGRERLLRDCARPPFRPAAPGGHPR